MSASLPGSWLKNWLAGKPSTCRPCPLYFVYTASSCLYCGVRPHLLATFTIRTTLPLYFDRSTVLPSRLFIVKSSGLLASAAMAAEANATNRHVDATSASFMGATSGETVSVGRKAVVSNLTCRQSAVKALRVDLLPPDWATAGRQRAPCGKWPPSGSILATFAGPPSQCDAARASLNFGCFTHGNPIERFA